ncbi:MAG: hypothetical protein AAGF45_02555 [Pseudomonadota bacterium]
MERAGPGLAGPGGVACGSITAVFTVLVEGDDLDEPIADAARGVLDGHIVLSRKIAEMGRYPAIDPLTSLSRMAPKAFSSDEGELSRSLRAMIARYEDTADLRLFGGYKRGTDAGLDRAIDVVPQIYAALTQAGDAGFNPNVFAELADVLSGRKAPAPAPASSEAPTDTSADAGSESDAVNAGPSA